MLSKKWKIFYLLIFWGASILLQGCTPPETDTNEKYVTPTREYSKPLNVVLISIDTLRADHLGCYGNPLPVTPNLDRLAKSGTLFIEVQSQSTWTLPSHWSTLTGRYSTHHGHLLFHHRLPDEVPVMAQIFKDNGYYTAGFTGGGMVDPNWGFSRGFDRYETPGANFEFSVPLALKDLAGIKGKLPFFYFVHGFDVHAPYTAPTPYDKFYLHEYPVKKIPKNRIPIYAYLNFDDDLGRYLSAYDANLRSADMQLGRLILQLKEQNLFDHTIFVITADHGEEFMDHGGFDHSFASLYASAVKTPLIVAGKGVPVDHLISTPVENIDVFPMVFDLTNISFDFDIDGRNPFKIENKEDAVSISENFYFHYLTIDTWKEMIYDMKTRVWMGIARSSFPDMTAEEAIYREFGEKPGVSDRDGNKHLYIDHRFLNYTFHWCPDTEDKASFVMFELYNHNMGDFENSILAQQKCTNSNSSENIPEGWKTISKGPFSFSFPPGPEVDRSLNSKNIIKYPWKLIVDVGNGNVKLFNKETDPGEQINVARENPEIVDKLKTILEKTITPNSHLQTDGNVRELDEKTKKMLNYLGYLPEED